ADDRHGEVADVLATELFRQGEAQEASPVGALAHLAQQVFPLLARKAAMLEIGPRPLAAVIEEAVVVVLLLERDDFLLDEGVDVDEQLLDVFRNAEVHGVLPMLWGNLTPDQAEAATARCCSGAPSPAVSPVARPGARWKAERPRPALFRP